MLNEREVHIAKIESIQLLKQILYMIDGGEDVCCALFQWTNLWIKINKYHKEPKLTTEHSRIFANNFVTTFQ